MDQKVEAQRGVEGDVWDDGFYDGIRKVHVGQGQDGVSFINAVYEKDSQEVEGAEHGREYDRHYLDSKRYTVASIFICSTYHLHSLNYSRLNNREELLPYNTTSLPSKT